MVGRVSQPAQGWREAQVTTYYAAYAGLLLAVIVGSQGRELRQLLYWSVLLGLFLFSGFRWEVGCDWTGYLYHYLFWSPGTFADPWDMRDPGHWFLIDMLQKYRLPYPYLNVATSAIFFFGLHLLARRQPNPLTFLVLAFPVLIINMPMSGIRQAAAIGFVCMAFAAFIDRRLLLFLGLVGLGSLFHSSALAFLLLAPFVYGDYSRRNLMFSTLLALPGVYVLLQSDAAELATSRYIDTGVEAAGAAFRLGLLFLTGVFYFLYMNRRWKRAFPEDHKLASLGALLMVSFFGLFFVSTVIGDRFGYYLIPIQLMIFTRIPHLFRGQTGQLFSLAPYALLTLVFVVWTQMSWHFQSCYVPYRSFL